MSECTELASKDWHFLSFVAAIVRVGQKIGGFSNESAGEDRKGSDGLVREIDKGRTIDMYS